MLRTEISLSRMKKSLMSVVTNLKALMSSSELFLASK